MGKIRQQIILNACSDDQQLIEKNESYQKKYKK